MSALDLIANAASGGVIGGITGVVGSAISHVANYMDNEQTIKAKAQEYSQELALQKLQAENKMQEDSLALEMATNTANTALEEASYSMPLTSTNVSPWINDITSLIRPCITVGSIIIVFFIWCRTNDTTLLQRITDAMLFLAISSCTWWFGIKGTYLAKSKQ